jgi:recombination protein RecA
MKSAALHAVLSEFSTLVVPASRIERPAVPTVPFGVTAVDELTGGLPRGCLTEICGPASSGRTSLLFAALAAATAREEVCALVDTSDCFDPLSGEQAGIDLERLLWVRCQAEANAGSNHARTDFNSEIRHQKSEIESRRRQKQTRFINSGVKNCGSTGVHTQLYSGMPQRGADIGPVYRSSSIPEVNVLTHPTQRYRDVDKLKRGDYSEPTAPGSRDGHFEFDLATHEKQPPQRHRDTDDLGSPAHRMIGASECKNVDRSENRNQKSEFELPPRLRGRCPELARVEQALKVTDLLLQSGGFGLIAVDFGNISVRSARRVPLASWFRFRRAVENTPTVLLVVEREAHAKSCASLVLELSAFGSPLSAADKPAHTALLTGLDSRAEVARGERKPVRSAHAQFTTRSAWSA